MRQISQCSPSNIVTGWRQKYFYKLESDGRLDDFIRIFRKHGNQWKMKKDLFEQILDQEQLRERLDFNYVYNYVLEINDDFIGFKEFVIKNLLRCYYQFSFKNFFKQLWRKARNSRTT